MISDTKLPSSTLVHASVRRPNEVASSLLFQKRGPGYLQKSRLLGVFGYAAISCFELGYGLFGRHLSGVIENPGVTAPTRRLTPVTPKGQVSLQTEIEIIITSPLYFFTITNLLSLYPKHVSIQTRLRLNCRPPRLLHVRRPFTSILDVWPSFISRRGSAIPGR